MDLGDDLAEQRADGQAVNLRLPRHGSREGLDALRPDGVVRGTFFVGKYLEIGEDAGAFLPDQQLEIIQVILGHFIVCADEQDILARLLEDMRHDGCFGRVVHVEQQIAGGLVTQPLIDLLEETGLFEVLFELLIKHGALTPCDSRTKPKNRAKMARTLSREIVGSIYLRQEGKSKLLQLL